MGLIEKWVESLDYEFEILPACTRHRSPLSTCNRCIDVCPQEAMKLVDLKPVIDEEKCDQCGRCISTCPLQAVQGIIPKRNLFQNQLWMSGELPTVKEMLVLYKHGVRGVIGEEPGMSEEWQELIDETNSILHQLNEDGLSISHTSIEMKEQRYSRRELFSLWGKEGKSVLKEVTPAKWRFNQNKMDLAPYYPDYQFAQLSIHTELCTLCKACVLLCDKDCIEITETNFSFTLQSCSACGLCVEICPEKAIILTENISLVHDKEIPIFRKKCQKCQQLFQTLREHDEKCVACTKTMGYLSSR